MTRKDCASNIAASIMNEASDAEHAVRLVRCAGDDMKDKDFGLEEIRAFYGDLLGQIELRLILLEPRSHHGPEFAHQRGKLEAAEVATRDRLLSLRKEIRDQADDAAEVKTEY